MKGLLSVFIVLAMLTFSACYGGNAPQNDIPSDLTNQNSSTQEKTEETLSQGGVYDYCYNLLNDAQRDIYNKILNAVLDMNEGKVYLTDDENGLKENVNIAFLSVSVDHPELFWLSGEYTTYSVNQEKFYIEIKYNMDETARASFEAALEKKLESILAETEGMSYFQKERYFHDYLCNNVTYTADGVYTRYTVVGALVNGKAVCEGYSRAMQLLCKRAGINCSLVKGISDETSHMWNIVEISGEWYELDVTWDDTGGETPRYKYFNLTTKEMNKDRTVYPVLDGANQDISLKGGKYNLRLPVCTATTFSKEKIEN